MPFSAFLIYSRKTCLSARKIALRELFTNLCKLPSNWIKVRGSHNKRCSCVTMTYLFPFLCFLHIISTFYICNDWMPIKNVLWISIAGCLLSDYCNGIVSLFILNVVVVVVAEFFLAHSKFQGKRRIFTSLHFHWPCLLSFNSSFIKICSFCAPLFFYYCALVYLHKSNQCEEMILYM